MRIIEEKNITVLSQVLEFIEAYAEYHICEGEVAEDGLPTDAKMLMDSIPFLKDIVSGKKYSDKEIVFKKDLEGALYGKDLENALYTAEKHGRESVSPNYSWCVCDCDISECYLTDDIGEAMEFSAKKSMNGGMWYVLKIQKSNCDGTYRTYFEGRCDDGHYFDSDKREFLHFDYIAQRVIDVKKIK